MRSDGDTWDITTSVGSTALFVATARALEAQKERPVAVDEYAEVFCRAVGGVWADVLDDKVPDFPLRTADFGRDFVNFQAARTKFFDTYFQRAIEDGVQQVVIPAAGLDSRAYRLPWRDGTVVYELDQPEVLEFKAGVLARHGAEPVAERRPVAVDLRDDWPAALRDSGFDPSQPSAWLTEGLLIYLPAAAQEQLFTGIQSLTCSGSHVGIEEGAPMDADEFAAKVEQEKAEGDTLFFQLVYNEQHAPAAQWFGERGWTTSSTTLVDWFGELSLPVPEPDSESASMFDSITLFSARRD